MRTSLVAHLHSAARALCSSPSRCFELSTNLDNDLFDCSSVLRC